MNYLVHLCLYGMQLCGCVHVCKSMLYVCMCAGTPVYEDAHHGHDMDARGQPQVGPQESSILDFRDRVFHWALGLTKGWLALGWLASPRNLSISASSMLG